MSFLPSSFGVKFVMLGLEGRSVCFIIVYLFVCLSILRSLVSLCSRTEKSPDNVFLCPPGGAGQGVLEPLLSPVLLVALGEAHSTQIR